VASRRAHAIGWFGLGAVGTAWVLAHWQVARGLDRLDRTWDPPGFLEPVERAALLLVGLVVSLVLVTGVKAVFRRRLARLLAGVEARTQVAWFCVPVLACLLASWRYRVMLAGPTLLLVLNAAQWLRGLPPSTPAAEVFGWLGRIGSAGWRRARALRRP